MKAQTPCSLHQQPQKAESMVSTNALTLRTRPRIFQMFVSVFLNTPAVLCSHQPDLPPPAGRTPPLTSCQCQPHPASMAALKFDLLMKLAASSSSPALIPQGSEQLLTFNSYLIYVILCLILPLWFFSWFQGKFTKGRDNFLCYFRSSTILREMANYCPYLLIRYRFKQGWCLDNEGGAKFL